MKTNLCALVALCGLACSANGEDSSADFASGAESENLGQTTQALSGAYNEYYTSSIRTDLNYWNHYEQFCVLAGMKGDLASAAVTRPNNGNWRMSANHGAWALCFPVNNFSGPAGSGYLVSSDGDCYAHVRDEWFGGTQRDTDACWWGDALSFVSDVSGIWDGGGEYVRVDQSSAASSSSTLVVNSAANKELFGYARSVFYGVSGGTRLVRLMGYNSSGISARGTMASSGTYLMSVSTYSGYDGYWLSPTSSAACALTKLGGEFNGNGEIARISPSDSWWYLQSIAGSGDVWASARCMAYNQN